MANLQNYNYRARNEQNQMVTGVIQASGIEAAKQILSRNKLTPLSIAQPKNILDYIPFVQAKVGLKDKTMFARQLSTMIEAGLTLSQALHLLVRQSKKGKLRDILEGILNDLQDGFSFSAALSKYPEVFDTIFINVVRSGEATGKLEVVLQQLATNLEKDVKVRGKIKGALFYPGFIILAMVGVAILMLTKVIPNLEDVFSSAQQTLPASTVFLITLSHFFVNDWYWVIIIVFLTVIIGRAFLRSNFGSQLFHKVSIKLPIAGPVIIETSMARFGRLLGMLLNSGVPLLEALRLIESSFNNPIYSKAFENITSQVERGVPMSVPISDDKAFPMMVGQMVAVGEQTGKMDEVMTRLADYYDSEVDTKVNGLSTLIEPAVIVLLGVGVAWLVIAILLPIYQISSSGG